ncbi:hypothetical protein MUK42_36084 [Musa troglodytarum]|uniref:Uncharacterized protein n=1 Tax=Musa troglodytarum TaxID=320322 RepID=A0A9E7JAD1_9LILI|nr:hypothetical protein MUK42_36084 [Musa troglodytarum]
MNVTKVHDVREGEDKGTLDANHEDGGLPQLHVPLCHCLPPCLQPLSSNLLIQQLILRSREELLSTLLLYGFHSISSCPSLQVVSSEGAINDFKGS